MTVLSRWVARDGWLVLLAAGTLLVSVLPYGARVWWGFELFTHFRLQYLTAAALLLALFGMRRRWGWCLLLLAAMAVNLVPLAPYLPRLQSEAVAAGEPLSVATANLAFWNRSEDSHARLMEMMRAASPDVVLLVEYTAAWSAAVRVLDKTHPHGVRAPREDANGIALYSRFPLADAAAFDVEGRTVIDARVETPQGTIRLVGVHLSAPVSAAAAARRNLQLRKLAALRADIDEPLMMLGDFNVTPYSPYLRDWLAETGLRDAALGSGLAVTWPSFLPLLGIPIDHLLVSEELTVIEHRRLSAFGSDHYPVVVRVAVERRE